MTAAGAHVEAHADHFDASAPDETWLTHAGVNGWVVLTKDSLRARPIEMKIIATTRVRTFILTRRNLRGEEMAEILKAHLPGMTRLCRRETGPFVATISGAGMRLVKRSTDLLQ